MCLNFLLLNYYSGVYEHNFKTLNVHLTIAVQIGLTSVYSSIVVRVSARSARETELYTGIMISTVFGFSEGA